MEPWALDYAAGHLQYLNQIFKKAGKKEPKLIRLKSLDSEQ